MRQSVPKYARKEEVFEGISGGNGLPPLNISKV